MDLDIIIPIIVVMLLIAAVVALAWWGLVKRIAPYRDELTREGDVKREDVIIIDPAGSANANPRATHERSRPR
jgi:hypothetical protein